MPNYENPIWRASTFWKSYISISELRIRPNLTKFNANANVDTAEET